MIDSIVFKFRQKSALHNFFQGFARVLDIGRTLEDDSANSPVQDRVYKSVQKNWQSVGSYFNIALSKFEASYNGKR